MRRAMYLVITHLCIRCVFCVITANIRQRDVCNASLQVAAGDGRHRAASSILVFELGPPEVNLCMHLIGYGEDIERKQKKWYSVIGYR